MPHLLVILRSDWDKLGGSSAVWDCSPLGARLGWDNRDVSLTCDRIPWAGLSLGKFLGVEKA